MSNTFLYERHAGSGVHPPSRIKSFSEAHRLVIADHDANGILLNEAIAVCSSETTSPNSPSDGVDDTKGPSVLLKHKMEELETSRKKFLKYLSEEQKHQITKSANTTESVLALVDSASFDWCKRSESGNATANAFKQKFHQACKALDQHNTLFSVLPKDSEYVSVFYGALNSIVAASVMHQAMASGLPKIVDELNAIVGDVAKKFELYPKAKQQMKRIVIELYARIFDLFAKLMKWFSKHNHLWKIMKKDCYDDFEHALQDIRNWVNIVNRGAWNNLVTELRDAHAENRSVREVEHMAQERFREDMRQIAENYYEMQENTAMQQAAQQAQLKLLNSEEYQQTFAEVLMKKFFRRFEDMGTNQIFVLANTMVPSSQSIELGDGAHDIGHRQLEDTVRTDQFSALTANRQLPAMVRGLEISPQPDIRPQTKEEVENSSFVLDSWFPEGRMHPVHLSHSNVSSSTLHESIASRLLNWTNKAGSQVLCIQFPYNPHQASIGSQIASYVVSTAYEVGYPIISYFCTLPSQDEIPEDRSSHTIALCEMMTCLIRQLVTMLPDTLPESSNIDLSDARFQALDGTLKTWDQMLNLFADLISLVPQSMLIVIHGMQCLNNEYTTTPIQSFLDVLRKRLYDAEDPTVQTVKVLFVTEGRSLTIVPWLQRGEYVVYEGDRRPGRQLNPA